MHGSRYLLALLPWLAVPAWGGLQLEPAPAWGGHMVPGRDTELGVQLISERQESFDLKLSSPDFSLHYSGHLEPDTPLRLWLPVRPGRDGQLSIRLRSDGGRQVSQEVRFLPRSRPFTVRAGPGDRAFLVAAIHDLPRTTQGYGPVDTMILERDAVAGLDLRQAQALSRYLGDCGRLAVSDADTQLLDGLRSMAGCGGRFVTTGNAALSDPAPAVTAKRLEGLHSDSGGAEHALWLAAFFLVYPVVLWAVHRTLRRRALLLLVPPLAGIGLAVASSAMPPRSRILVLVETTSGAPQGRLSALLTVEGNGLVVAQLPLIAGLGVPRSLGDHPVRLIQDPDHPERRSMPVQTPFLGSSRYAAEGVVNLVSGAIVDDSGEIVRLENRGPAPLSPGMLAMDDTLVATPPLAPGEYWSPGRTRAPVEWSGLAGLLRERTGGGSAWILPLPEADSGLLAGLDETHGWLLVHGLREQTP